MENSKRRIMLGQLLYDNKGDRIIQDQIMDRQSLYENITRNVNSKAEKNLKKALLLDIRQSQGSTQSDLSRAFRTMHKTAELQKTLQISSNFQTRTSNLHSSQEQDQQIHIKQNPQNSDQTFSPIQQQVLSLTKSMDRKSIR